MDTFGNFVPGRPGPVLTEMATNTPTGAIVPIQGSPEGRCSYPPGWRVQDTDTGNVWVKKVGTGPEGWELAGTVGAAGLQVLG